MSQIKPGASYGWPSIIANGQHYPANKPKSYEAFDAKNVRPLLLYEAHSAPLGLVFNKGSQFPKKYQNDSFVTMHGFWNRIEPSGYKLVRVHFNAQGQPERVEDFITGFLVDNNRLPLPCGLVQAPDGSLLMGDNGVIYRKAYTGKKKS